MSTTTTKSVNLAAPVFVPKTSAGTFTPRINSPDPTSLALPPAGPRADAPEWPQLNTSQGLGASVCSLHSSYPPISHLDVFSSTTLSRPWSRAITDIQMSYEDPSFHSHYQHHPNPQNELTHHLYTPSLPFISNPPMQKHPLHSFFIPDDLRHMIQARQDATHLGNVPVQGLPHEVGPYHSLMPLDRRMGVSKIYGYPTPLYRAVSSIDGGVYCLRRVEGECSLMPLS